MEIVLVEEMKFDLVGKSEKNISSTGKASPKSVIKIQTQGQVRKLKEPFLKVPFMIYIYCFEVVVVFVNYF